MLNPDIIVKQAEEFELNRDFNSAEHLWGKLSSDFPREWKYFGARFRCLVYMQDIEALVRCMDETYYHFSKNVDVVRFLCDMSTRAGLFERAEADFKNLLSLGSPRWTYRKLSQYGNYRKTVFNTKGISIGSDILPLPDRINSEDSTLYDKHFIFVSGMPRSGTTAFGSLLRRLIGERLYLFTELTNPFIASGPESFNPSQIKRAVDKMKIVNEKIRKQGQKTNTPGKALDHEALSNYQYIGDKRPLLHYSIPHMQKTYINCKVDVFHIIRDPIDVLHSCALRAEDPNDSWDPLRSYESCAHELNIMYDFLLDYFKSESTLPGFKLHLIDYKEVLQSKSYIEDKVVNPLGLDRKEIGRADSFIARSTEIIRNQKKVRHNKIIEQHARTVDKRNEDDVFALLQST